MKLNLKNPLAFFDLETTGTNTSKDRIVEISIVKSMPNGEMITKTMKINPTIPIPVETSLIHGIYDEDVKDAPTFKMVAKEFAKFLEGADLGGFNILKFDIPVIVEEFLRAEVEFDVSKRKLVDAQKIFHAMEKRTLGAAYKFYCGKTLDGAHSAEVDTKATLEVFEAQMERYENETIVDNLGKELGVVKNDMKVIHDLFNQNLVDLRGSMVMKNGIEVFNFGKHRGKPVTEILQREPGYYDWMMRGDFPLDTKNKLTQIKLRGFNK